MTSTPSAAHQRHPSTEPSKPTTTAKPTAQPKAQVIVDAGELRVDIPPSKASCEATRSTSRRWSTGTTPSSGHVPGVLLRRHVAGDHRGQAQRLGDAAARQRRGGGRRAAAVRRRSRVKTCRSQTTQYWNPKAKSVDRGRAEGLAGGDRHDPRPGSAGLMYRLATDPKACELRKRAIIRPRSEHEDRVPNRWRGIESTGMMPLVEDNLRVARDSGVRMRNRVGRGLLALSTVLALLMVVPASTAGRRRPFTVGDRVCSMYVNSIGFGAYCSSGYGYLGTEPLPTWRETTRTATSSSRAVTSPSRRGSTLPAPPGGQEVGAAADDRRLQPRTSTTVATKPTWSARSCRSSTRSSEQCPFPDYMDRFWWQFDEHLPGAGAAGRCRPTRRG